MGQQGLLPGHSDPKLWICEARSGEEREAVIKLLQKAVNLAEAGRPLLIKSAFTQDHLKVRVGHGMTSSCSNKACAAAAADPCSRCGLGPEHLRTGLAGETPCAPSDWKYTAPGVQGGASYTLISWHLADGYRQLSALLGCRRGCFRECRWYAAVQGKDVV